MKYYKKLSKEGNIELLYKYSKKSRIIEYYINGESVRYSFGIPLPCDVEEISSFSFFLYIMIIKFFSTTKS